jgi:dihydropteroate synthase
MGILNITPDSFYDGSQDLSVKAIQNKYKNIKDASIIDIGCESTRPGSFSIEASEEIRRLGLALPIIRKNKDKIFSIDTSKEDVAKFALENGFKIINDITAGRKSKNMLSLAADYNAKIILMHMLGTPDIMQENPRYTSVIDELDAFFEERIEKAIKANIKLENIIIDPGIGFGKTISDNDLILQNIGQFKKYNCPILIGVSRKSFLQHMEDEAINRLPATLGVTAIAINNGADIVRVHDVKQTISMLASVERIISV